VSTCSSIEYIETVLRSLLFQRTGFYSNNSTWHSPTHPNACLCYLSQPGVYSGHPKPHSLCDGSQPMGGGPVEPWGIPHRCFQCRSNLAVHRRHPVVVGRRGTLSSSGCLYVRASRWTLTARGLWHSGCEQGFGFWL
jgi:hypothetical protein